MALRIAFKCQHCHKVVKLVADPFEAWLCPACKQPVDVPIPGEGGPDTIVVSRDSTSDTKPAPLE
jgi:hypothetical protein